MTRSEHDAELRDRVLLALADATECLMGAAGAEDAFHATVDDLPGLALERIETARDHLRRAETALRKWIGDRREL